jgi:hypothetical protein
VALVRRVAGYYMAKSTDYRPNSNTTALVGCGHGVFVHHRPFLDFARSNYDCGEESQVYNQF